MMFSSIWVLSSTLSLLLVGAGLRGAKADETKIVVDFSTDVSLNPPDAWFSEYDNSCQNVGYYTAQINATASLTFTGDRIQISGLRNNQSGIFRVSVDDEKPYEGDLYSGEVDCTLFVDFFLHNGTHNMTIELLDKSINASEGAIAPVLHLTNIVYFVPGPGLPANNTSSSTPATGSLSPTGTAPASTSSLSSATVSSSSSAAVATSSSCSNNVDVTVGGLLGGLIVGALVVF